MLDQTDIEVKLGKIDVKLDYIALGIDELKACNTKLDIRTTSLEHTRTYLIGATGIIIFAITAVKALGLG